MAFPCFEKHAVALLQGFEPAVLNGTGMDKIIPAIAFNEAKPFVYIKPFNGATLFICHGSQRSSCFARRCKHAL